MKRTGIIFAVSYVVAMLCLQSCNISYSDGDRAGVVVKFSKKGFTCKTWEGELLMGGLRQEKQGDGSGTTVPNVFPFSVKDMAVIEKLNAAMLSGDRVLLHYDQIILHNVCTGETGYFITDVKQTKQ